MVTPRMPRPENEIVLPGAVGSCVEAVGGNCLGRTRLDTANNVARIACPLVTVGGCGAPKAEAPVTAEQAPSETQIQVFRPDAR